MRTPCMRSPCMRTPNMRSPCMRTPNMRSFCMRSPCMRNRCMRSRCMRNHYMRSPRMSGSFWAHTWLHIGICKRMWMRRSSALLRTGNRRTSHYTSPCIR